MVLKVDSSGVKINRTETLRLYLGNVNSSNPPGQQEERPQTGGPKGRLFAKLVWTPLCSPHTQCDHGSSISRGTLNFWPATWLALRRRTQWCLTLHPDLKKPWGSRSGPLGTLNAKKPGVTPLNKERASEKEPSQQRALSLERATRLFRPIQAAGRLKPGDRTWVRSEPPFSSEHQNHHSALGRPNWANDVRLFLSYWVWGGLLGSNKYVLLWGAFYDTGKALTYFLILDLVDKGNHTFYWCWGNSRLGTKAYNIKSEI